MRKFSFSQTECGQFAEKLGKSWVVVALFSTRVHNHTKFERIASPGLVSYARGFHNPSTSSFATILSVIDGLYPASTMLTTKTTLKYIKELL
jgi:hypothetical protein